MKITYFANTIIPSKSASSVHVMKICEAFANLGHDVELVVRSHTNDSKDSYLYYGVKRIFKIIYIKRLNILGGGILYSLSRIRHLFKDSRQVVYSRTLNIGVLSAICGFKTIWESHLPEKFGLIYKMIFRYKKNVRIVVISSALKDYYLKEYHINSNRIIVLPDCSDEVDFDSVSPVTLEKDRFNVGYIGSLQQGKGMEIVENLARIYAGEDICNKKKITENPVMFHIIGGSEPDVLFWKEKMRTLDNVKFYGHIPRNETPRYGLAMDALIAPYLKEVYVGTPIKKNKRNLTPWMSPLKIFEYMSYRKPIIASDLPVLYDVLNDKNSVMCRDICEWIAAIKTLSENPQFASDISNRAYEDFLSNYTWNIRCKKIMSLFDNIEKSL